MTPSMPGFSPSDDNGEAAVDQALARFTAVGKAERSLDDQRIAAIAQMAAAERRRATEPIVGEARPEDPTEPTVLEPADHPNRTRARRPGLVLAAAVLLVVAAGAVQALSRPGQLVVTQESGSAVEQPARPVVSVEALAGAEARTPETTSSTVASTTQTSPSTTVRTSIEQPDDGSGPSTTETAPAEPGPPDSAPVETGTPDPTTDPSISGPSEPGPDRTSAPQIVSIPVGEAGEVWLTIADSSPTVVEVRPRTGWTATVDAGSPPSLDVVLDPILDGPSTAAGVSVRSDETGFRLLIDPGQDLPEAYTRSRTFDFAEAGTVTIGFGVHGLADLQVDVGPGWAHDVSTPEPDHIDIRLIGPRGAEWTGVEIWIDELRVTIGTGP